MEDMPPGLQDEILRPSFPQNLSVIEDHDPVEAAGLIHVGGADEKCRVLVPDLAGKDLPEFAPGDRIDTHGWLIEKKKRGSMDKGAGHSQFLLHSSGEFAGQAGPEGAQGGHRQKGGVEFFPAVLRDPVKVGMEVEIFGDGEILIEAELLGHVSQMALEGGGFGGGVESQDPGLSAIGPQNSRKNPEKGGLARPVGADKSGDGPGGHIEGDIV
jgi:hypothetical protein